MDNHKALLHLLRMDGPLTETEILDELPQYRWALDEATIELKNQVFKVRRRVNCDEFEDVWVATPKELSKSYRNEPIAILHAP